MFTKNTPVIEGELGHVFVTRTWLPENDDATIALDITSFLGSKTIRAKGLKPVQLV